MGLNFLKCLAFLKNQSCNQLLKIETKEQIVAEQQFQNVQSSFVISVFTPGAHSASKHNNLAFTRWEEADSTFIFTTPAMRPGLHLERQKSFLFL